MERPDGISTADDRVHLSLIPMSEEWYPDATALAAMQGSIAQLRPGAKGWCTECARAVEGTEAECTAAVAHTTLTCRRRTRPAKRCTC